MLTFTHLDPFDHNPFGPMTEKAILEDVVDGYMQRDLPLNVVVLDMEWHTQTKFPECDTFLGIKGWGGYTFNKTLFPNPNEFIDKLHEKDIHIALNLHPDGTIDACQEPYVDLAKALGVDPSTKVGLPDLDASQKINHIATPTLRTALNRLIWTLYGPTHQAQQPGLTISTFDIQR